MESTPFELTPAQKGVLESLARETGRAIPALLDEALAGLQEHVRHRSGDGAPHDRDMDHTAPPAPEAPKPIWEWFIEASLAIPDEELDRLPPDGATQHDHYIYGTPKRPV